MDSYADKMLCLIPARGGSKRLPRKNVLPLAGRPLISWTIANALEAGVFSDVVVSTEDREIADAAVAGGARLHQRPAELAGDTAQVRGVTLEFLDSEQKAGREHVNVCILSVTCPLRGVDDVRTAHRRFMDSDAMFLLSVVKAEPPPVIGLNMDEGGWMEPLMDPRYLKMRRQEMPVSYYPNGAIFMYRAEALRRGQEFCDDRTLGHEMPAERSVNIDTALDFKMAELLMTEDKVGE